MTVRDVVRAWDAEHGADDAPIWAEALGTILAIGLIVRAGAHVWAAVLADIDPTVDEMDVRMGNVVLAARSSLRVDAVGRHLAAVFGVVAWVLFDPLGMTAGSAIATGALRAFVVANLAVLLGDPVLFAIDRLRPTQHYEKP